MPWKRFAGWAAGAVWLASSGCCWWCDRWCPHAQPVACAQQQCTPCCCTAPAYQSPQVYSSPAAGAWGPAPPAVLVRQGNGCYCESPAPPPAVQPTAGQLPPTRP
jgi:hypothetical protein